MIKTQALLVVVLVSLLFQAKALRSYNTLTSVQFLETDDKEFQNAETAEGDVEHERIFGQDEDYSLSEIRPQNTKRIKCLCGCKGNLACRIDCMVKIPDPTNEKWAKDCMIDCFQSEEKCYIRCNYIYNGMFCPKPTPTPSPTPPPVPQPTPKPSIHCTQTPNTWAHLKCLKKCNQRDAKCCARCNIYYRPRPNFCTNNECSRKLCQKPCKGKACFKKCHDRYPPLNEIKV